MVDLRLVSLSLARQDTHSFSFRPEQNGRLNSNSSTLAVFLEETFALVASEWVLPPQMTIPQIEPPRWGARTRHGPAKIMAPSRPASREIILPPFFGGDNSPLQGNRASLR